MTRNTRRFAVGLGVCLLGAGIAAYFWMHKTPAVRVGSKAFPESVILGETLTLLAENDGYPATHRAGLGGTQVVWRALLNGEIDAYVEYTGTIRKEIFTGQDLPTDDALRKALSERGVAMSRPLGFENTYALGMRKDVADRLNMRRISDLNSHPDLKLGFTSEFLDRSDGWPGLRARYHLPQTDVRGMEHALAYASLTSGAIDVTDLYSTDAKIRQYDLRILEDDAKYFPKYDAVLLYRSDLETRLPRVIESWRKLEGRISANDMTSLNSRAEIVKIPERRVAADYLVETGLMSPEASRRVEVEGTTARLVRLTGQHLSLVGVSLAAAIFVALPLGIIAASRPRLGQGILAIAGIMQTIPSIALLVFMIPLFGIGLPPAMAALFLYSLLPIIRNTYAGLHDIPLPLRESAAALGLPTFARLRLIELPMASRMILAGIKTAGVINVGTATLGGFIGAGGYGELIFTGLYKFDTNLILQGAVPTALMALLLQGLFEIADRILVPRGLRLRAEG